MPVTKTEQTTKRKKVDAAKRAEYQKDVQALKVERDKKLAGIHSDRDAAQLALTTQHRAAVRQVWDDFHEKDRKLRKKMRGDT